MNKISNSNVLISLKIAIRKECHRTKITKPMVIGVAII